MEERAKDLWRKVLEKMFQFEERKIKYRLDHFREVKKDTIVGETSKYLTKVDEILDRFMDTTDSSSLITELKKLSKKEQVGEFLANGEESADRKGLKEYAERKWYLKDIFLCSNIEAKDDIIKKLGNYRDSYRKTLKIDEQLAAIMNLDDLESRINELMFENFLNPIEADLKQIIENREGREKQRADAAAKLDSLQKQKQEYEAKVAAMAL